MPWCQGAQNIGLSHRKLRSALKVHRMITMHARPRRTMNIMAIVRRFILRNASRAKNDQKFRLVDGV